MFHVKHGIALHALQGYWPHLAVRGMSHGFSQFAVGTWLIISIYNGNGPSKLVFVQRRQDSFLVVKEPWDSPRGLAGQ